jgi:hypothetical protein
MRFVPAILQINDMDGRVKEHPLAARIAQLLEATLGSSRFAQNYASAHCRLV